MCYETYDGFVIDKSIFLMVAVLNRYAIVKFIATIAEYFFGEKKCKLQILKKPYALWEKVN